MDEITVKRYGTENQAPYEQTIEVRDLSHVSDGYHTIAELYDHRITLFIALCRVLNEFTYYNCDVPDRLKPAIWRSKKHDDGSDAYEGWFVLGIGKEIGEIMTYHIPLTRWDQTSFAETIERAHFDGHTSVDVLERLKRL